MSILEEIVRSTRRALNWRQKHMPLSQLKRLVAGARSSRDFPGALVRAPGVALIAEVKRASPSAGIFVRDFDPLALARTYEANGAAAISVLTEEKHFGGSLDILAAVAETVSLPVLLKDFVIDAYQIYEARAVGADAVLLIGELLDDRTLERFLERTRELGMEALVEAFDESVLARVCASSARIVGINNRDLATFKTSLETTLDRAGRVPDDKILVSESGIRGADDVRRLAEHRVRAILVGESLVRAPDTAAKVRELSGVMSHRAEARGR